MTGSERQAPKLQLAAGRDRFNITHYSLSGQFGTASAELTCSLAYTRPFAARSPLKLNCRDDWSFAPRDEISRRGAGLFAESVPGAAAAAAAAAGPGG